MRLGTLALFNGVVGLRDMAGFADNIEAARRGIEAEGSAAANRGT
jgi:hypothetical protein